MSCMFFLGILAALAGLVVVPLQTNQSAVVVATPTAASVYESAPDFTVTVFDHDPLAYAGESLTLSNLRGSVVVVNFWASWAAPSRAEAPLWQGVWQDYQDQDVIVLGINYADSEAAALDFIAEFGLTYPNAPDSGGLAADAFGISGVPEAFIISRDGRILDAFYGAISDSQARQALERAINR